MCNFKYKKLKFNFQLKFNFSPYVSYIFFNFCAKWLLVQKSNSKQINKKAKMAKYHRFLKFVL